jgi:FAD/FMN-containing dehydrogenase
MKKIIRTLLLIFAVVAASVVIRPSQAELFESGWLLASVPGSDMPYVPRKTEHPIYFSFDQVAVGGYGGCNSVGAARQEAFYSRKLGLFISPVASNARACLHSAFEVRYIKAIAYAVWYQSNGNMLTRYDVIGRPIAIYRRHDGYKDYRLYSRGSSRLAPTPPALNVLHSPLAPP